MIRPRMWLAVGIAVAAVVVAGCGSSSTGGSSSVPQLTVKTGTASIAGQSTTVLTNKNGFTLYYNKDDTSTTPSCTDACLSTWPPLLLPNGTAPPSAASLPGVFSVLNQSGRSQIEYNGHELYIYTGDTASGQANGQASGNIWYVATPTLAAGS